MGDISCRIRRLKNLKKRPRNMDEVFESESEAGSGKCDTSGLIIDNTTAGNRFDGNYQLRCGGIEPLAVCASIN